MTPLSGCGLRGDRVDVVGPTLQRLPHLAFVPCSIVDACNAGPVTAHMVENRLDNVRQDAEFGHHSRGGAAQIMQSPIPYRCQQAPIKVVLAVAPACAPSTEYNITPAGLEF